MYIIGYGTGRCGTKSLAALLKHQPNVTAYHEDMSLHWLPMPGYRLAIEWLKKIDNDVVCSVGYYWIKYLHLLADDLDNVKHVHIWREKEAVVESFWNKKKKVVEESTMADEEWFGYYPFLGYPPTKDRIAETWEKYHYIAKKMATIYPTYTLHTDDLNDMSKVSELLEFISVPKDTQVIKRVHLHKAGG